MPWAWPDRWPPPSPSRPPSSSRASCPITTTRRNRAWMPRRCRSRCRLTGNLEPMSATDATAPRARAGRPRDPATDRAITAATFRLLREEGYRGLSMESVAAAAGVAKTTIYRRYRSKRELVVASVVAESEFPLPPPDLPPRDAYAAIMRQGAGMLIKAGAIRILGTVIAEEDREPELLALARTRLLEPRREYLLAALRAGVARRRDRRGRRPRPADRDDVRRGDRPSHPRGGGRRSLDRPARGHDLEGSHAVRW